MYFEDCLSCLIRSKLDYAAPAWQPWLSATNLSSLDPLQNCALRLVTDQLAFTPLETLRLEANVQIYHTSSNELILRAREKTLRNTDDHPRYVALITGVLQHIPNRCSFRRKANDLSLPLPAELKHRQFINHFLSPPSQSSTLRTIFPWYLSLCKKSKTWIVSFQRYW